MIGFVNNRTGARTQQLKGFPTETEPETVARFKAAGWDVEKGSYEYDATNYTLTYNEPSVKTETQDEDQKSGDMDAGSAKAE